MRIAILTFHRCNNNGAALQCLALQQYLTGLGHTTAIIDYTFPDTESSQGAPLHTKIERLIKDGGLLHTLRKIVHLTLSAPSKRRTAKQFAIFRQHHFQTTPRSYSSFEQIRSSPPDADIYICGSDQIWNPDFVRQHDLDVFLFRFLPENAVRIAYAASICCPALPDDACTAFRAALPSFSYIGLREPLSTPQLEPFTNGTDIAFTPDPTFLHDRHFYERLLSHPRHAMPLVAKHLINSPSDASREIANRILSMFPACERTDLHPPLSLSTIFRKGNGPSQWLSAIASAKLVVTNSFHCAVFCLIFHTPFWIVPYDDKKSGMNIRLTTLLKTFHLEHLLLDQHSRGGPSDLIPAIDWAKIDQLRVNQMEIGRAFISRAIAGAPNPAS